MKDWVYNEFEQVGVDYAREQAPVEYDEQMLAFRNYAQEVKDLLQRLGIEDMENRVAADMGCGTGSFAVHAAKYFQRVHAVDVSPSMLESVQTKAEQEGIANIVLHHSGFLQFQPEEQVEMVHSKWSLHHLPDFWKQMALLNIYEILSPGGVFVLTDVVFHFARDLAPRTQHLIDSMAKKFDPSFVAEAKIHIREEYSTFTWIMQGMLERAGFCVESVDSGDELAVQYICRKPSK
ncbi:MAG: class I SAM-dependent methyltransferase [Desulfovibrio sp.]|nr:MAG: class I SAM-dependent methyltransferase [Desulfovibrio sp.]